MTITFNAFNGNNLSNSTDSSGPPTSALILNANPTASVMTFSGSFQSINFVLELDGNFNLSAYDGSQTNLAQLLSIPGFSSSTITGSVITVNGLLAEQDSFSSGVNIVNWLKIQALGSTPTLGLMNQIYKDQLIVHSATGNGTGDNAYGYSGSVTYYENHTQGKYSDCVIGGTGGINSVILNKASSAYTISVDSGVWDQNVQSGHLPGFDINLTTSPGVSLVQVSNVQRLQFTDTTVALDISPTQTAGSVYMLYQATFNRTPDAPGLGYWINAVDKGANIITNVAASFIQSPEFVAKYGANPSNASYVDNLYQNVLHRAGESGGVAYWNQQLNTGAATKAFVLEQFATLAEGAALVAPAIAHGIAYQQWVG